MAELIFEQRAFKKLKALLNFASTFVFKDLEAANSYETADSIMVSNSYISAVVGNLPYSDKYQKSIFPSDINEYNLMSDGIEFFVEAFRINSKYVGLSSKRYNEVRAATATANKQKSDPEWKGNVFEFNAYYRSLYCDYDIDPKESRIAGDYALLFYDPSFVSDDISVRTFLEIFNENRIMFIKSMENKGFNWESQMRTFNKWFITVSSIFSYLDNEMGHPFDVDAMDQYEIRNYLYSFGVTYLNDLPSDYQLRVIKNLRKLMSYKGTDKIFSIIIDDIFGDDNVNIYKYYLLKSTNEGDAVAFIEGTDSEKLEAFNHLFANDPDNLVFVKIPFDVVNIDAYLSENTVEKYSFEEIVGTESIPIDEYWQLTKEETLALSFRKLQTKYVELSMNTDFVDDTLGVELFFSMLHENKNLMVLSNNSLGDDNLSVFNAFAAVFFVAYRLYKNSTSPVNVPPNGLLKNGEMLEYAINLLAIASSSSSAKEINYPRAISLFAAELSIKDEYKDYYGSIFFGRENMDEVLDLQSFSQKYKNNLELLKKIKELVRFTYPEDDNIGISLTTDSIIEGSSVININRDLAMQLGSSGDSEFVKGVFAQYSTDYANPSLEPNSKPEYYAAGIKGFVDLCILQTSLKERYENRNELESYNYGTYKDLEDYLKAACPVLYTNISQAASTSEQKLQEFFNSLLSDISLSLSEITVINPFTNEESKLSSDVSFKGYGKYFILKYAKELIERFKSYTVQLYSSDSSLNYKDPSFNTIQFYDNLEPDTERFISTAEYLWTGENPRQDIDIIYDTDRIPEKSNNGYVSKENIIDKYSGSVSCFSDSDKLNLGESVSVYVSSLPDEDVPEDLIDIYKNLRLHRRSMVINGRIFVDGSTSERDLLTETSRLGETVPIRFVDLQGANPVSHIKALASEKSTEDNIIVLASEKSEPGSIIVLAKE